MKPSEGVKFCERYSPVELTPWQTEILRGIFQSRFSLIVLPSGYYKTGMAALAVGAHLICEKRKIRSFGLAGDLDQAGLLSEALEEIFQHDHLARLVDVTQWKISLKHGAKSVHETLASHVPSVWGRTPDLLVVDELAEATAQSEKAFFATVSALRKTKHSKLIIITSPSVVDVTAHRILEAVRHDPAWNVQERTSDDVEAPWLDTESEGVYDILLPPELRAAKHKGHWVDEGGGMVAREWVDRMQTDDFPDVAGRRAGGGDLAYSKDWAALAVAEQIEQCYYVPYLNAWIAPRGGKIDLTEIEDELYAVHRHFQCAVWNLDPSQAILMIQRLEKEPRRVPIKKFDFSYESRKRIIARLLNLVEAGRFFTRPNPALKKQLLSLSAKRTPSGLWKIDHRPNQKDDLVIAAALALEGLPEYAGVHKAMGLGERVTAREKMQRQRMENHLRSVRG